MWKIRETQFKVKGNETLICGRIIRRLKIILINKELPLMLKCATYLHEGVHRFTNEHIDRLVDVLDITTKLMEKKLLKNE